MGRLFGRRPDPTPAIRRAVNRFLEPGEEVLAGVYVQSPGTNEAAMEASASAGINSAIGFHGAKFSSDDTGKKWTEDVVRSHGIDPDVARRTVFVTVALTNSRVLLIRRSRVTRRRGREVFASWPLAEVERIAVPRGGSTLRIIRGDAELRFELPLAIKFLDKVYTELPRLFERAQADLDRSRPTGAADGEASSQG